MIATLEKRPLWGIDAYVHYVVLGLSIFNLIFTTIAGISGEPIDFISIALSILGVVTFFLMNRNNKWGNVLFLIWVIPQLILWSKTTIQPFTSESIDLSQWLALPINITSDSLNEKTIISINTIAVGLLIIALFKLKHQIYQTTIYLTSIDLNEAIQLTAKIKKIYSFDNKQRALILNTQNNGQYYALVAEKSDKLRFDNFGRVYSIFEIHPDILQQEQIRISEFKKIFSAKAST